MNKALLVKAVVAVSAVAMLSGFTRCGHHRRGIDPDRVVRHIDHHVDDFIDDVDANDTQAAQIRALTQPVKSQIPDTMKGHYALRDDMKAAWAAPAPDGAVLHKKLDAQIQRTSSLLHAMLDAALELHEVLTPEQRAEVAERWE